MNEYKKYALGMNAREEVLNWIDTVLKNRLAKHNPFQTEVEHIIDYLCSPRAPRRLLKMSYPEAKSNAKKWTEANQKKGRNLVDRDEDIETIHDFADGSRVVRLKSKKAYQREGHLMRHCLGGYDPDNSNIVIYSYRDKKNMPHATFEVRNVDNEVTQIKGKGNGSIHPKYIEPIMAFLKAIDIEIRPHDMKNLGYHHIDKKHMGYVRSLKPKQTFVMIHGNAYVCA